MTVLSHLYPQSVHLWQPPSAVFTFRVTNHDRRLSSAQPNVPTAPPMRLPIPKSNPNPNPNTHPNPKPLTLFLKKINPNPNPFFERKQKRHRNIGQQSYIYRLFTKGRGWLYQRPISEKGEVFPFSKSYVAFLLLCAIV